MKQPIEDLVEPKLSYQLIGICLKVHNVLGPKLQEKYYQRAVEIEFKDQNIPYLREVKFDLDYKGQSIGRYFFDFLIDGRILLELKTVAEFTQKDVGQVLRYLRKSKIKLGILVNFSNDKLEYKRIINNLI